MVEVMEKTHTFGKIGNGLSSLFGETKQGETVEKTVNFQNIPVSKLSPGTYQPRTEFNPDSLKELAESISKSGILQPIIVRPRGYGEFEIVAGERRWRAARLLNLETVPVIIRELSDRDVMEVALVENIQRKDLNPLEEAYAYRRLLGEFGYTQDDLARTVGKSRSHIANLLRLLTLPEKVKNLLSSGELSMSHARTLLGCNDPEALAVQILEQGLSVRQAEELAQSSTSFGKQTSRNPKVRRPKNPDIIAMEDLLGRNLGAQVDVRSSGRKGEIRIKYKTLEDLDNLLRKLGAAA